MTGLQATKYVIDKLVANTTFTSKLSLFGTTPAIVSGLVVPTSWDIKTKSVNIYVVSEASTLEYFKIRLSASCRGTSYSESRSIAYALCDAIHRFSSTGFSIVTTVKETAEPFDADIDNYLTPVEIMVRSN